MKRYKLNVAGDFYVVDGLCISCTMPVSESPNLIGEDVSDDGYHCYFKKQPQNSGEIQEAINAIYVSCCGALGYGGSDKSIIEIIKLNGDDGQIDVITDK